MNGVVAIEAGPGKKPVTRTGARKAVVAGIERPRVPLPVVTILAKIGNISFGQLLALAAVGRMASRTPFLNGRMLPHEGTALIAVTLVTKLVFVFSRNHEMGKGPVGVVTIAA